MRRSDRMGKAHQEVDDCVARTREWERRLPRWRRGAVRLGIQGKLFLGFVSLLLIAMSGSYWLFIRENRHALATITGEHAVELSHAIAMASEPLLSDQDLPNLQRIGRDLLRNRDIVAVAFYDKQGTRLTYVCQDLDEAHHEEELHPEQTRNLQNLMQVRHRHSPALGEFAEVTVPVLRLTPVSSRPTEVRRGRVTHSDRNAELIGYVSVSVAKGADALIANRVSLVFILLGGLVFVVSMPIVYWLVNRILLPIRQLVVATIRIAGGDLDTHVEAADRPDVIGILAQSFNEMVQKVKAQRELLAHTNEQLAEANNQLALANVQLEEANRDLEAKVRQRTAQLEMANKRLSSEIAEKEDFLRAVSHDLNAPLRNISGMASMLLMKHRDKFDEDVIHRLDRIQKNVQIETDLISELLELSRIKTRRQQMEPVELDAMVRELGEMFENDLKTRGISLVVDTPLPVLQCERARVRQVFQNLIDNAIKYMGDGPVREIHIGCTVKPTEAEFYVRDTGIGIDPEDQSKVFYVFRRGKSQAVQNVAGKGVGLASVKSIIETYSGTIWVESAPGQGSTFRFTINGQHVPACMSMHPVAA